MSATVTLTLPEAAALLRINREVLRRHCAAGRVPGAFQLVPGEKSADLVREYRETADLVREYRETPAGPCRDV